MKKTKHTIKIKNIDEVELIDLTTHAWLDFNGNQIPWVTGSFDFSPSTGSVVYNTTGSQSIGYYQYNGNQWSLITGSMVNNMNFDDYQVPLYLESSVDELGPMIQFDGDIANEVKMVTANFAYSTDCRTITITNNTDYSSFKNKENLSFTIHWDDGGFETIGIFETKSRFYPSGSTIRNLLIVVSTPFGEFKTSKTIDCNCDNQITFRILQEDFYPIKSEDDNFLRQEL
jgi:hypothetical protein